MLRRYTAANLMLGNIVATHNPGNPYVDGSSYMPFGINILYHTAAM